MEIDRRMYQRDNGDDFAKNEMREKVEQREVGFFDRNVQEVATDMIGKQLVSRHLGGDVVRFRIVEAVPFSGADNLSPAGRRRGWGYVTETEPGTLWPGLSPNPGGTTPVTTAKEHGLVQLKKVERWENGEWISAKQSEVAPAFGLGRRTEGKNKNRRTYIDTAMLTYDAEKGVFYVGMNEDQIAATRLESTDEHGKQSPTATEANDALNDLL
jgi:hypothetical protein